MATTPSTDSVFQLMYRSHSRIAAHQRQAELGSIFSAARANNKKAGVTGALLVTDDWFVQVLEGEADAVRALYQRICADTRHERITLITEGTAPGRTFARWAMAKVAADGEPDIPLITNVDRGGIVPAAGHPISPDQEAVLDRMRNALDDAGRQAMA
jgi:Sensors of blue-light using FAD